MRTCEPTWANKLSAASARLRRALLHPSAKPVVLLAFGLVTFLLASCRSLPLVTLTDPETRQENTSAWVATADPGHTVGQTFLARRTQINNLSLWVKASPDTGLLQVDLYHTPADESPIFSQNIPFDQLANGILSIHLPANLPPPKNEATGAEGWPFYVLLRPLEGTLQVRGRSEDIYGGGQAYLDQTPLNADLAFTTTYEYDTNAFFADLAASLPRLWLVLPLLVILVLPGWLLLDGTGLARRFDGGERIGLVIGLSLAITPLAMLWSTNLGLRWGRTGLLIAAGVLLALALWRIGARLIRTQKSSGSAPELAPVPERVSFPQPRPPSIASSLILPGIFVFALGVRLIMARDLAAPAWVDSVHHATITRLIMEHGGFPSTYSPYIDIAATQYHAGFHSLLATLQWLSGMDTIAAMLLFGQVLNALIVFAAYLLTVSLTRQRSAGLVAALIAGVFTPMPAYYTSWGRYTELAGLLILPAGLALAQLFFETDASGGDERGKNAKYSFSTANNRRARAIDFAIILAITAIACAGLAMVHYRVAGFLGLLYIAYFASRVRVNRRALLHLAQRVGIFCLVAGVLALLLTLPWSWQAITGIFIPKAAVRGGSSAQFFEGFFWQYLTAAWGLPAMLLAGLGLAISLFRRLSLAVVTVLWTGLMLLAGNLNALHLPGSWFINTISVVIALFLPTAVLAGYGLGQIIDWLHAKIPAPGKRAFQWATVLLGAVVALLAAHILLPILRPSTDLFRTADRPAMTWINANLPADATIVINPFYWGYNTYAGSDGGFWITPLTGRKTIPPPVLYALAGPLEKQRIATMCQAILDEATNAAGMAQYLRAHDLHYVYLGARGGAISPSALSQSDQFQVLYHSQGVWIFKVR